LGKSCKKGSRYFYYGLYADKMEQYKLELNIGNEHNGKTSRERDGRENTEREREREREGGREEEREGTLILPLYYKNHDYPRDKCYILWAHLSARKKGVFRLAFLLVKVE
jgi:Velvet factor.